MIRDPENKDSIDFEEVPVQGLGETSKNSTSFTRLPGKLTDDVRGSRTNLPFWPGGFDPPKIDQISEDVDVDVDFDSGWLLEMNICSVLSRILHVFYTTLFA